MIFQARIGGSTITQPENAEARSKDGDIAVFPLAMPILAGPGAMLLMAGAKGSFTGKVSVIAALFTVMAVTFVLLPGAHELRKWIGVTAQRVIMRVLGITSGRDCCTAGVRRHCRKRRLCPRALTGQAICRG